MMKDFQVVCITDPLKDEHVETVVAAFSELYNSVTSKHQRRMQLNLICRPSRVSPILDYAERHKIEEPLQLIPYNLERQKDQLPLNATVLFLPTKERVGRLVRESLSKSIPVVSFLNESVSEYIDQTCGLFVRDRGFGFNVDEYSKVLRMMYFDPEVRKLMHKGAKTKYLQITGGLAKKTVNSYTRTAARSTKSFQTH